MLREPIRICQYSTDGNIRQLLAVVLSVPDGRFLVGRLPSRAWGGAKTPLAAAWAGADARCPFR
jgi:hypothetical protein